MIRHHPPAAVFGGGSAASGGTLTQSFVVQMNHSRNVSTAAVTLNIPGTCFSCSDQPPERTLNKWYPCVKILLFPVANEVALVKEAKPARSLKLILHKQTFLAPVGVCLHNNSQSGTPKRELSYVRLILNRIHRADGLSFETPNVVKFSHARCFWRTAAGAFGWPGHWYSRYR